MSKRKYRVRAECPQCACGDKGTLEEVQDKDTP